MTHKKIFLDPGHGGRDVGASGNGFREKDLVLRIALRVRDMVLREYDGAIVRLSRSKDVFVPLDERAERARYWNADLFISIHMNAFDGTAQGVETFRHTNSTASREAAKELNTGIVAELRRLGPVRDRGIKRANFAVLRGTYQTMRAVLTENLFIDSTRDRAIIQNTEAFIEHAARGHVRGIAATLGLKGGSPVLLRNGSRGHAVTRLQRALMKEGYQLPKFGADGRFGAETEAAVRAFQKDAGVTVDGLVGPHTRKALKI